MTTPPRLGDPVTTDGSRSINFFNGRLLSAEDLRTEQDFAAAARRRLGLAVGPGVISGLRVTLAAASSAARPVVTVEGGRAVNRTGDVVELPVTVDVDLTAADGRDPGAHRTFGPCRDAVVADGLVGAGVYLMVVRPAGERRGRAPTSGLDVDAGCAADATVEGASFGLLPLELPAEVLAPAARPLLRNRVAHLLLGSTDLRRYPDLDPLSAPAAGRWGLLDDLYAAGRLDDACIPLAVLAWSLPQGFEFVDNWAARRRPARPSADARWPVLVSDRRLAEAEAAYQQFQDQVDDVVSAAARSGTDLADQRAADIFELLPPVGIVPVGARAGDVAFGADVFLGDRGSRHVETLDGEDLGALLADGLAHRPRRTGTGSARFRRYWVYENLAAVAIGSDVPLAMVFAAEPVAPRGTSRYGFARFGASTVADVVDAPRQED